jgi:hypothetical protein
MKRVLTAILVLFGFACGDSQSLLTPEQFTRDIAQRFQHPDVAEVKVVERDYLFSIPSRDTLMVTGTAESGELIQHLRETTRRVFRESPYAFLDALFVYRDGQIERYKD